jgi:multimeric flavodoxin WrbA
MLVLGLQGSPRRKGNSAFLLDCFLSEARTLGARTRLVEVDRHHILPCKEYTVCEKRGTCPIEDDMAAEIYGLLREAEFIVLASPVFFYNVTAQLKALIDRCQTLWARKYRLKLADPRRATRRGFMLAVGATAGKNLFEGLSLTAQYFCDAIDARYAGSLTYRRIEGRDDAQRHPTAGDEVRASARRLLEPLTTRHRLLFVGRGGSCAAPLAAALAQRHAGERLDVESAGSAPAAAIDPRVTALLQEKGIDIAFQRPQALATLLEHWQPATVVDLGAGAALDHGSSRRLTWPVEIPDDPAPAALRGLYDMLETRVLALASDI